MHKLYTERLEIKIITLMDAGDVFISMNSRHTAEIISFLNWPMTMVQAEDWCRKAEEGFANKSAMMFIARHKDKGAPVGCIGLHHIDGQSAEVGYWITDAWQRQGMVSEMLRSVIDFAFGELRLQRLWATTAYDNPASDGVLIKGGFRQCGEKDVLRPDGSVRKSKLFDLKST